MKNKTILAAAALLAGLALGYLLFAPKKPATAQAENCATDGSEIMYTCAMHQHILQQEKGACPICGMTLFQNVFKQFNNPDKVPLSPLAMQLADIQTQTIGTSNAVEQELRLNGRVVPDERRVFHQISHLPGIIEKLYVTGAGQYVKKGQPIASVYSRELMGMIEQFEYSKNSEGVIRSAINNLKGWKISEEQIKSFDIKKGNYHRAVDIYAEFSGTVLKKYVSVGDHAANDYMAEATRLYDIADLSRMWVLFDVYEKDLGLVKAGDLVRFTVSAYPERDFIGKVTLVEPSIDPQTRSAAVRVETDNVQGLLKPEMMATGILKMSRTLPQKGIAVPKSAVLWTGEQSLVYVKDRAFSQPVFECREVRLGREVGENYLILSGLQSGEQVVVNGAFRLDAAAQLARKRSMMSQIKPESQMVKN